MSSSPVILILGAGPNIGQHVAQAFAAKGYKVALASRTAKEESTEDGINISSDLSDPESVVNLFSKVKESLGLPSVVVYNGQYIPFAMIEDSTKDPADALLKRVQQLRTRQRIRSPCLSRISQGT